MALLFPTVHWGINTNIYEVNIRQYSTEGTFEAFNQHIPRLANMGVKILWLMPITPISEVGKKGSLGSPYACSSYTQVNPAYGNIDALKLLVKTAHDHGQKVIIDWVANHTGMAHEWTKNHPEWFVQNAQGQFIDVNGWDDVIDLNYNNADMQNAMIQAMEFWITEVDIDGFRCDMAHLVPLDFWKKARTACQQVKSELFLLAECDNPDYLQVFDVNYAWDWMHQSEQVVKKTIPIKSIIPTLQKYYQSYPQGQKLYFTSNHDENSWNGTEYEKYGDAALQWAILTFALPGIPLLYSGQEIPNKKRLAFFEKDALTWPISNTPTEMEQFYTRLYAFRQANDKLYNGNGKIQFLSTNEDCLLGFTIENESQFLIAIFNFSDHDYFKTEVNIPHPGIYKCLLSGIEYSFSAKEEFILYKNEALVYYSK